MRDELLGLPVRDRDYVVVGATPEEMLKHGFKPVGKDFPVFLHPQTHEEYALARTERKTGPGYKGFVFQAAPDVTLEQDLARRDLTINAIAKSEDGSFVDPYGGRRDLEGRVLRHVGTAFAEDPVRVLRVARFAARFHDFTIADETLALMRQLVTSGEVDHLVPERIWQELSRALMEAKPSRALEVLRACGGLERILPEVARLFGVPQPEAHHPERDTGMHILLVIDYAAMKGYGLSVRFAALVHDLGKALTPPEQWPHHYGHEHSSEKLVEMLCERLRVPSDCRDLGILAARNHCIINRAAELRANTIVRLLERCDAFRRPERFARLVEACACDFHGRTGFEHKHYAPAEIFDCALEAATQVDTGAIARDVRKPHDIAQRIREARIGAVCAALG